MILLILYLYNHILCLIIFALGELFADEIVGKGFIGLYSVLYITSFVITKLCII